MNDNLNTSATRYIQMTVTLIEMIASPLAKNRQNVWRRKITWEI